MQLCSNGLRLVPHADRPHTSLPIIPSVTTTARNMILNSDDFPQPQVTYILFKIRISMIFLLIMILIQTGNKNVKCWIGNWFLPSTTAHPSHLIHFTRTLCLIFYIPDNWTFENPLTLLWQDLTVSASERHSDSTYKEFTLTKVPLTAPSLPSIHTLQL